MTEKQQAIAIALDKIANEIAIMNSVAVTYGKGITLYPAEIHVIELIGLNEEINITRLADCCGVKKGTTSRQITKLAEKGYVMKIRSNGNKKEVIVRLTELGLRAFEDHKRFHDARTYLCFEESNGYSNRELDLILEFLGLYSKSLEKYHILATDS